MSRLSDKERLKLQAKMEETRGRRIHHITKRSGKLTIVAILVIAVFAILGGIAGYYGVFRYNTPPYSGWKLEPLLYVPMGAIAGAIIGLFLVLMVLRRR